MTDSNKIIDRRFYKQAYNHGAVQVVDECVADAYRWHDAPPDIAPDKEGLKQWIQMVADGFPDFHLTIEDQIEEGDQVVARWHAQGTHRGAFMGFPATGQSADITGVSIHRFVDGQIHEAWTEWDRLALMQQLGLAPTAERA